MYSQHPGEKKIPGVGCWRDFSWKAGKEESNEESNEDVTLMLAN